MSILPKWVRDLPDDDQNKSLLIQIANASKNSLDTPREMNFAIKDLSPKKNAQAAAQYFDENGWEARVSPDNNNPKKFWVEASKQGYSITKDRLYTDEAFAVKLANMYDAVYDGWYAGVAQTQLSLKR